ncbi:MAG: hypothetical protein EKE20_16935 [Candidatus Symbiopectobacterium sp. Dall1.0]|nr:hypothetical protein [Candidatus Symbiopectobacterium sp. Dall1.0]
MKIQAIGVFWYKDSAQYHDFKKIFADSDKLHIRFSNWKQQAEKLVKKQESNGIAVVKAYAEPAEFVAWCRANGHTIDSKGRAAFANIKAHEYLVSKS